MLTAFLLAAAATDWWNADWEWRRPISIQAIQAEVPRGAVVRHSRINPQMMGLGDPAGWRLVRGGEEVPMVVRPLAEPEVEIVFRASEGVARGARDAYWLYYGNPNAPARAWTARDVYAVHVDFAGDEVNTAGWVVERTDGGLVVRGFGDGPAEVVIPAPGDPLEGFFEAELTLRPPTGAGQVLVGLRVEQVVAEVNDDLRARVAELIGQLGDPEWRVREEAQQALIEVGEPALAQLEEASRNPDPEVASRAQFAIASIRESRQLALRTLGYLYRDGEGVATEVSNDGQTAVAQPHRAQGDLHLKIERTTYAANPALMMSADRNPVGAATVPPHGAMGVRVILQGGAAMPQGLTLVELCAAPKAALPPQTEVGVAEQRP